MLDRLIDRVFDPLLDRLSSRALDRLIVLMVVALVAIAIFQVAQLWVELPALMAQLRGASWGQIALWVAGAIALGLAIDWLLGDGVFQRAPESSR